MRWIGKRITRRQMHDTHLSQKVVVDKETSQGRFGGTNHVITALDGDQGVFGHIDFHVFSMVLVRRSGIGRSWSVIRDEASDRPKDDVTGAPRQTLPLSQYLARLTSFTFFASTIVCTLFSLLPSFLPESRTCISTTYTSCLALEWSPVRGHSINSHIGIQLRTSGWFPFLVQANNVPNQDLRAGRQKTPPDAFYNPWPSRQHCEILTISKEKTPCRCSGQTALAGSTYISRVSALEMCFLWTQNASTHHIGKLGIGMPPDNFGDAALLAVRLHPVAKVHDHFLLGFSKTGQDAHNNRGSYQHHGLGIGRIPFSSTGAISDSASLLKKLDRAVNKRLSGEQGLADERVFLFHLENGFASHLPLSSKASWDSTTRRSPPIVNNNGRKAGQRNAELLKSPTTGGAKLHGKATFNAVLRPQQGGNSGIFWNRDSMQTFAYLAYGRRKEALHQGCIIQLWPLLCQCSGDPETMVPMDRVPRVPRNPPQLTVFSLLSLTLLSTNSSQRRGGPPPSLMAGVKSNGRERLVQTDEIVLPRAKQAWFITFTAPATNYITYPNLHN
ncbi:uncharacterized protein CLUP02_02645 [Colletotrichum lupini]|uniref:Uncharacterized protein n=1 Tax=Colletotrichum lupini TaxID=145971 RepID=A0A9Q8SHF0_9PEZI|nr:uncharacterized protein CLUP02_02645 [Colletotrichum lupini]UQC77178.1 hypothetical protein CLUP02_02645 [Colletotrichum lupini]